MKLGDVLLKAGKVALSAFVPGGGLIVDVVNEFLPKDKQLPKDATGEQIQTVVEQLPPEQKFALLSKELDVEIAEIQEFTKLQTVLADADKAGASTRPYIAKMMAYCVFIVTIAFSTMWIYCISADNVTMMEKLIEAWPLMVAVLGTPTALLRAYFAMRTKEKEARYQMASSSELAPMNPLVQLVKAFKK